MANKKAHIFCLSCILLILSFSIPAQAELYQYTDKNGNVVITDSPPSGTQAKEKRVKEDGIYWSESGGAPEKGAETTKRASIDAVQEKRAAKDFGSVTAVMYMTSWCGYCKQAASYVRSLGANLVQYDIDADSDRKAEMKTKSSGSSAVPLLDIGGTIIRGYNPTAIKNAIEKVASR